MPHYHSCTFNSAFSSAFVIWYVAWDCGISTTSNIPGNCTCEKKVEKQIVGADFFFKV